MSSKKILLFGATGGTGFEVAKQLTEAGFIVTAVVRNPDLLTLHHDNLKIVKGDVLEPDSFAGELKDSHAVISALGTGTSGMAIPPTRSTKMSCREGSASSKRIICPPRRKVSCKI